MPFDLNSLEDYGSLQEFCQTLTEAARAVVAANDAYLLDLNSPAAQKDPLTDAINKMAALILPTPPQDMEEKP